MAVEMTFFVHEYPAGPEQSRERLQVLGADHVHDVFAEYEKKVRQGPDEGAVTEAEGTARLLQKQWLID